MIEENGLHAQLAREVLDCVRNWQPDMVEFLRQLVQLESPSSVPEAQEPVFGLLQQALEELDFRVRRFPGRSTGGYLFARPRRRARGQDAQMLLGHCDTVWPLGTLQDMPVLTTGSTMRGPGVFDMKGGLTQMIFALRALQALGMDPPLAPLVLINSDEELGSHESTAAIRRLARVVCRTYVLEPALGPTGKLKTARKGVGRFSVVVSADGMSDDWAESSLAVLELSYIIQQLFALNDPERGVSVNVGTIRANMDGSQSSRAEIDVRVPDSKTSRELETRIQGLRSRTPGVKLEIRGKIRRPPLEHTPRNRALWQLALDLGGALGLVLEEGRAGGGSDGNTTSQYTATLDGLGAVGSGAHADHEFVYLDRMVERTALLALLIQAPHVD